MKDSVPERRRVRRVRIFHHAAILWILATFDILSYVTGKRPIATGIFTSAFALYSIYLIS